MWFDPNNPKRGPIVGRISDDELRVERQFSLEQADLIERRRKEAMAIIASARRTPYNRPVLELFRQRWPYAMTLHRVAFLTRLTEQEAKVQLNLLCRQKILRSSISLGTRWYEINMS